MSVRFIVQRAVSFLLLLFGISVVAFGLMGLVPGDPSGHILASIGVEGPPEMAEALTRELKLSDPVPVQYGRWLYRALHLDLGTSYRSGLPVVQELGSRAGATAQLAIGALAIGLCLAIPIGIWTALHPGSKLDVAGRMLVVAGASIPSFWLGLLLAYVFCVCLKWLPLAGGGGGKGLVLPAVTLGLGMAASYTRLLRSSMLDTMGQGFIQVARAKGLKQRWLIVRHGFRYAMIPVLTWFGISIGHLLGGSVIVETIFSWPGLGRFAVESILGRDYPVIQGYVIFSATVVVTVNLMVDCVHAWIDPRVRLSGGDDQ